MAMRVIGIHFIPDIHAREFCIQRVQSIPSIFLVFQKVSVDISEGGTTSKSHETIDAHSSAENVIYLMLNFIILFFELE